MTEKPGQARSVTAEDGNLPAALNRLADAISGLCDKKPVRVPAKHPTRDYPHPDRDGWHMVDGLYTQLVEATPGSRSDHHSVPRSLPVIWVDAVALLSEIDTAVSVWTVGSDLPSSTPERLTGLHSRSWRPQDVRGIEQISAAVEGWTKSIQALLTDERAKHLSAPCPACGVKTVHRDSAGERVRSPALQITSQGCQCQSCRTVWAPDRFTWLARVLGYELPPGVLE